MKTTVKFALKVCIFYKNLQGALVFILSNLNLGITYFNSLERKSVFGHIYRR